MPSDNLSLGFLTPSRTFLCLYIRGTPRHVALACACVSLALLRGFLSLSLSLSQEPRVFLSLSLALSRAPQRARLTLSAPLASLSCLVSFPRLLDSSLLPRGSTRLHKNYNRIHYKNYKSLLN